MIETGYYFAANEFIVIPTIGIRAGKCEDCDKVHVIQLSAEWLWYGVFANISIG